MEEMHNTALKKILRTKGNLSRPVPAGTRFGTLPNQRDFDTYEALAELPYPPVADRKGWCEFDPETRSLTSTVFGMVRFTEQGILVQPCWELSADKTLLVVEVHPEDWLGQEITSGRLMAVMPPEFQELELDTEALNLALEEVRQTRGHSPAALARGLLPEPGVDGRLQLNFDPGQVAGAMRNDGSMDFRERGGVHFVTKEQELGILYPPLPGTPGQDVFGQPIAPPEPKTAKVKAGPGVSATENDDETTTFKAARAGVAHFLNGVLEVSELLEIRGDVDYETGNIRAESGAVHIRGAVKSGFTIEASGDVIVDGIIEEADISAGGLVVAGGVIMNGKNRIRATGNVSAKFFQNAVIEAEGDVNADREISHCRIKAKGRVTVLNGKGIISGGHVISGSDILAKIIGNESRGKTIVEIRLDSPEQDKLMEGRNQLAGELSRLDNAIGADDALTTLMTAPEEDRRILAELIKVRGKIQADIRSLDNDIAIARQVLQEELSTKQIKAQQLVYSGVDVILGGKRLQVTEELNAPRFHWDLNERQIITD